MRTHANISLFSRKGVRQILLIALVYWFFLGLTKYTLHYAPGIEFRLAGFVPIIGGMFFGLPGAIGAGLGNFLGDLGGNDTMPARLCGMLANFYLAYVPYRIWYGFKEHNPAMFIYNQHSFLCFVLCLFVAEFNVSAFLCVLIDYFYNPANGFLLFTRLVAAQYSFPVLLGLPLLLYLRSKVSGCCYPTKTGAGGYHKQILVILTCLNLLFLTGQYYYADISEAMLLALAVLTGLMLGYICTMPVAAKSVESPQQRQYVSLVARFTMALMILLTGFIVAGIVLTCVDAAFHHVNFSDVDNWQHFDTYVNSIIVVLIGMIYLMLGQVEKNVSNPLESLSKQALNYIEDSDLAKNQQQMAEKIEKQLPAEEASRQNELASLESSFYHMSEEIRQSVQRLAQESEKHHGQQAQLNIASQIQQGLMPNMASINQWLAKHRYNYHIQSSMNTATLVGGDMYDCYPIGEDYLLITVADVSGKGVPAALFGAVTQAFLGNALNNNLAAVDSLGDIVARVNGLLQEQNKEMLFVTMWVGILQLSTGEITYVNAGHNPALLKHKDQTEASQLDKISGPVLGLMENVVYTSYKVILPPGGRLLVYTDGITEAENSCNEFYGTKRLLKKFCHAQTLEALVNDVLAFAGDVHQSDDATCVWLERLE